MKRSIVLVITALALAACGGPRPAEETTETWTSGDDEALGIAAEEDSRATE